MRTIVGGIRVSESLWKDIAKIAQKKGKNRNKVIVGLITNYCKRNSKVLIDKGKKV